MQSGCEAAAQAVGTCEESSCASACGVTDGG
jgi:hypothetical protein